MSWIVIRNWEQFQGYKDRTVPWIKLYAELQHDEQWLQLPVGRRGMLTSLWLEYMFSRCRLPADTRELSRRLRARVRQDDLDSLIEAGFILVLSEPSPTHIRLMSDLARARATHEEKKREEKKENVLAPSASNLNGQTRKPSSEEIPAMIDVVTACQHFIAGRAWDDTFDEQAMIEEFGRIERGRRTEGSLNQDALAGLLEQWKATRQDRYDIKANLP